MYAYVVTGTFGIVLLCVSFSVSTEVSLNSTSAEEEDSKIQNASIPDGNVSGSGNVNQPSNGNQMFQVTLPFVQKHIGLIECEGANPELSRQFFEGILGPDVNYNQSDYLCGPTCKGRCVPKPKHIGVPPSIYPFGCNCEARGCGLNGPIVAPMTNSRYRMVCKPDPRCTCFGMGPGQFTGFSCSWINLLTNRPVSFKEKTPIVPAGPGRPPINLPPQFNTKFHPVKFCSCCPRIPRIPKELD